MDPRRELLEAVTERRAMITERELRARAYELSAAYVSLSRARDQTDIYLSREDLGHDGLDPETIEHLAQLMQQSHTQDATVTRELAHPPADRSTDITQTADRSIEASRPEPAQDLQPDIQHVLEGQQEREQDRDRDIDLGFGIE